MATNHNWLHTHLPSQDMLSDLAVIDAEIDAIKTSIRSDVKIATYVALGAVVTSATAVYLLTHFSALWVSVIVMLFAMLLVLSAGEILTVALNKRRLLVEMKGFGSAVRVREAERIGSSLTSRMRIR